MKAAKKGYPSAPDAEGFYFQTEEDESAGILTRDYENGGQVKKVALSNGTTAIIRKLKGRDFVETKKQIQADNTLDFETVNMAVATTIDGKQQPPEYYLDDLFQGDFSKLIIAYSSLNFQ
ncbi:MAG: hypothetical protein JSS64_07095 [Bacteroidetes bacterium]|nr:hypothetical protein [Bacteroidota bacterium]